MGRPPELLYAVDETPPPAVIVISAVQHVAVISVTLVFPLIFGREAGLKGSAFLSFVSLSMLAVGMATILLCLRSKHVGSGYLCPACHTAIYLGPSLFALQRGGLSLVFGMTIAAGLLQTALGPVLHRMRALMPSEIAGLVIAIVGLALASLGVRYMLGITPNRQVEPLYLIVSVVSLAVMAALNVWTGGYLKMFCVLIGMLVGYAASAAYGLLDFKSVIPVDGITLLHLPRIDHISYQFDLFVAAPFMVAAFASALRVMGDTTNCQRLDDKDWVRPDFSSLSGAVSASGLATVMCGLVGSLGPNSYSSSIGLAAATGVTSRVIGYAVGILLIVLAFVPAAAVLFVAMPAPVMGAALFFTSAFVFTSGLQMITARMLDARKVLVIGFSFAMAVMADIYHDVFMTAPEALKPVVGSSLVLGTVCAVVLNLILRLGVRKRATLALQPGDNSREAVEQFLGKQGAQWAARRDVVTRATFGVIQLLELLKEPSDSIELEASFDEFNLDLIVRYAGVILTIPEERPSPREVLVSDEGERLLAGYLLRRTADKIEARALGERAEVLLHYDH